MTPAPPTEGMRASVGTYTLDQGVGENSSLFFFLQENFGVQILPEGSTQRWEGERPQQHMCCRPGYCLLAIFSGEAQEFFLLMYARVHTCACVCCIVCMQVRLP